MTTQEKWEEIYDVLDNMNVRYDTNYCGSETEAIIEFWTDTAKQDIPTEFDYDGTPEDFVKQFTERANSYDVDEEVELFVGMRGEGGVPDTVRELLDDCQEAKDTLMEIADKLQKAIAQNVLERRTNMAKYRVWAEMTTYCYIDVEAQNEDEAYNIAKGIDGGEFITSNDGHWEILTNPDLIEN